MKRRVSPDRGPSTRANKRSSTYGECNGAPGAAGARAGRSVNSSRSSFADVIIIQTNGQAKIRAPVRSAR